MHSAEPLPPLPAIPRSSLVIVEGRAPIWSYGMALHLLHGSAAAAVAGLQIRACETGCNMDRQEQLEELKANPKKIRFTRVCQIAEAFGFQTRKGTGSH
jgi:hypothetical protein